DFFSNRKCIGRDLCLTTEAMKLIRNACCVAAFCGVIPGASADKWSPISVPNAPTARTAQSGVFSGITGTDQMIVWGGQDSNMVPFSNTGGLWKSLTNRWTATTTADS